MNANINYFICEKKLKNCEKLKMKFAIIILINLININFLFGQSDVYEHSLEIISPSAYTLYWNYSNTNITAEIVVKTLGWVSFGITNKGELDGSDLFVAWVTTAKTYFIDSHYQSGSIVSDLLQNWQLLNSFESNGYTTIKFTRKIILSGDDPSQDVDIETGTPYISYAYGVIDPKQFINYQTSNKGVLPVHLISSIKRKSRTVEKLNTASFRVPNITLPNNVDFYFYCKGFEFTPNNVHITKVNSYYLMLFDFIK